MRATGRASVSASNPRAFAICDRCGFLYNHHQLSWQFDYAGAYLVNKRLLVCASCNDTPNEQLRAIVIPPDPVPIQNPRPQNYAAPATDARQTSGQNTIDPITGLPIQKGDKRVTQDDATRVTQQTGEPVGGLNTEPGTDPNAPGDEDPGLPYGNTEIPKTGPL